MYEWNAEFHDRDRKVYPAQVQHLHNPADYEGPRVYCVEDKDEYGKPKLRQVLFRTSHGKFFQCVSDPDSTRLMWQAGNMDVSNLPGRWYRCIYILPQIGFNEVGSQTDPNPEISYVKIPVVDLMVDFTAPNGKTRINHVGNARHIGDALQGAGIAHIPYYTPRAFAVSTTTEQSDAQDDKYRKKKPMSADIK